MTDTTYTVILEGDGREMAKHLFEEIAPYGKVIGVCIGNEMKNADDLRAENAKLRAAMGESDE